MGKGFLLAVAFLILTGCAATATGGGSVDKNVRDYNGIQSTLRTKQVDYYCSFDKIATGNGEYCISEGNEDYVSYFTKFDNASARSHLIQTVSMINSDSVSGQLRYYQIYTSNGDYNGLQTYDIRDVKPTSFILKDGNVYRMVITKADLLMRIKIYPELSILDIEKEPSQTGLSIGDYNVVYGITPYVFKARYSDSEISRILGVPDYTELGGKIDSIKRLQLNNYTVALENYWRAPDSYTYEPDKITAMDHAMPQLKLSKLSGAADEIRLKTSPPLPGEGLLNNYLPPYDLEKIEIIYTDIDGTETVARSFERNDLVRVLISHDNDALVFSDAIPEANMTIRFVHKATAPSVQGLGNSTTEALGIGWIYSDLAATIETNLHVERLYQLEELPVSCVNRDKFIVSFINKGHSKAQAEAALERMSPDRVTNCTEAQISIGETLAGAI